MDNIIDMTFGINKQALAVGILLSSRTPGFADYKDGFYDVCFQTRPWYNGREQGVVITMSKQYNPPFLHVAWFEHRNSDSIHILSWETKNDYFNSPNEDPGVFDAAYKGGDKYHTDISFNAGEIGKTADWVYDRMGRFYKSLTDN